MGSTNINNYEYEGFIKADEENEFNIYFQRNEHEVEVLSEDLEVIDSRRQACTYQLVENSNLYAIEKGAGTGRDWYPSTVPELKIWIALLIYMGLFKFPSVNDYWNSDDRFPKHKITQHMSLYRFQQLIASHVCF
ncbi:11977_t:CDS:2 [Entrophospora sp. SA101]|nr:1524_t:CDS:2 [Entrophospora sp. SA101]CAJ0849068.1 11977_t:CDS:2 [Entrophospora sp. SA101]